MDEEIKIALLEFFYKFTVDKIADIKKPHIMRFFNQAVFTSLVLVSQRSLLEVAHQQVLLL